MLSRFDLVFLLLDSPDSERDQRLTAHVMAMHSGLAARAACARSHLLEGPGDGPLLLTDGRGGGGARPTLLERLRAKREGDDPVPVQLLRKYIAYARQYVHPRLSGLLTWETGVRGWRVGVGVGPGGGRTVRATAGGRRWLLAKGSHGELLGCHAAHAPLAALCSPLRSSRSQARGSCAAITLPPLPPLADDAVAVLKEYYLQLRAAAAADPGGMPVTARQLESLVRLAEARARVELREEVSGQDAEVRGACREAHVAHMPDRQGLGSRVCCVLCAGVRSFFFNFPSLSHILSCHARPKITHCNNRMWWS
jgi:hypothetical protein